MKNEFDIAVMPGDGIGQEITRPSFDLVADVASEFGVKLTYTEIEAGADLYRRTGESFPEENFIRAKQADAIYLAAMGLPNVRYPDGTEIGPQHDLRKRLELYAGVRPCITMPGLPLPLIDERSKALNFVIVRESTEGIFAYPRSHELDSHEAAYNLIKITRRISEKLFDYSFSLAQRRKSKGTRGLVTCIDKANVLSSMFFFRSIFNEVKEHYPEISTEYMYVDAAALNLIRRPWEFDVCPVENQFGDILSDEAAALMGGMGMSPSGEIGDDNAVFQPCHGSAPDIAGKGIANPTGMILSGAMMLDYLGTKFSNDAAIQASETLIEAVKSAYRTKKLLPYELGGSSGTAEIFGLVNKALEKD
ncbi:isocitrate/isopropylmalate dehydrogenase family protein [Sediminispirochaeta smaragdinae]|uniref:3-isopropylmalate dehydrogenase n=1 Tax=Sediminispirochaeta smaragdinae (strain DSM 11293 / JCM 15392 / SEBR 4228) TaxID=573413 RepID=E1RAL0_SEDSS|nr:isocitrate/isopropylmalate family dehydrogenase [Sediminispirochaeta smaragdinae]ADK82378.1 3-isopropylmalate dehydrogenase [Sediminispirochaeta smaragdinae DSM 11293]